MSLRVLFLSHSSDVHGAEMSLVEAARSLSDRSVHVQAALPRTGPLEQKLVSVGVPVTVAQHRWLWWATVGELSPVQRVRSGLGVVRRSGPALKELRTMLRDVGPDVVVTNTVTFPHGAVAARLERVPHVWYVREVVGREFGLRCFLGDAPSLMVMGALSTRVVACSEATAARLRRRVSVAKIRVVYNAVQFPESPVAARRRIGGPLRLLALGRLDPVKGQEDAIRATALLAERGVDVELSIVGSGPDAYLTQLAKLAESSAARGRVAFHGYTATPAAHLDACDVFLMTSRYEPFGRVTVEAMRAGRPVVAAGTGGTLELVSDEWNGLLYRPGDAGDLARQIVRLREDPGLTARLATRGQEWARQTFSLEKHGSDLHEVLLEAVQSSGLPDRRRRPEGWSHA